MDSQYPYLYRAAEECNSSESGWTMYIGSPGESKLQDESYDFKGEFDDGADVDDNDDPNYSTKHNETSDDSMASDASSGPSLREQPWEIRSSGRDKDMNAHSKKYGAKVLQHRRSNYKAVLPAKNRYMKGKEEKDEVEEIEDTKGAKVVGHGVNKARKNHGLGKRK